MTTAKVQPVFLQKKNVAFVESANFKHLKNEILKTSYCIVYTIIHLHYHNLKKKLN